MTDQTTPVPAITATKTSLQQQLRASRKRAANKQTEDFQIPGYSPALWGTFRAMDDYSDVRRFVIAHVDVADEAEKELLIAADTLAASCTDLYVKIGDTRADLEIAPQGFTPQSAAYLVTEPDGQGGERPVQVDSDRQAVFAIFPNTSSIMELYGEMKSYFNNAGIAADEELLGNAAAPSSAA
jgi:hypothetical protein